MKNIVVCLVCLFFLSCTQKQGKEEFASLFPFVISYDGPDNVTNMSHLLEAPAGKHGFIRVENGHFVNDAGRVYLNATNLTGSANFPSHKQADLLAKRLARFGINCVRLHYMDANYGNFKEKEEQGIFTIDPKTQRNLDPNQMDRMDYMIAQFKKKGIYVNINLHVARKLDERDGFSGKNQRPYCDKGVDNFDSRMIDLQKEFARNLLTHVNPYTDMTYTNDPCVAMVEINNENSLHNRYINGSIDRIPDPYAADLREQWNEWLKDKYKSLDELSRSWKKVKDELKQDFINMSIPTLKFSEKNPPELTQDFYQFLFDVEERYYIDMYNYLKDELKVKPVISGTQLGFSTPFIQEKFDYVDNHVYWCHPKNSMTRNISMVNSMATVQSLASQRVFDKPYTISEYNHPFPNQFGAEGQPMLRAYGRLQDWDGVFQYTYCHRLDFEPQAMTYFFDMVARTDVLAHMPACAAIYLRGDVCSAKEIIKAQINHAAYFDSPIMAKLNHAVYFDSLSVSKRVKVGIDFAGFDPRLSLVHKTAVELTEEPVKQMITVSKASDNQKVITSDTGELTWNMEKEEAGYWTVNTANTKLFIGFPDGRTIELGGISLDIGKTRLDWATISLVSKNATGFGESGKPANILLTATGLVENKGMIIENTSEDKIKLTDWGSGPIHAEGIPAVIKLPSSAEKTKCFALDPRGDRKHEIPVEKLNKGKSKIEISPEYKTIWYEIELD